MKIRHLMTLRHPVFHNLIHNSMSLVTYVSKSLHSMERWGAGVEYHFQEFNEPYAPS